MPGGTAIYRTTFSYFHNSTISQFRNSTITLSLGSLPSGLAHVFVNGSKVDAAAAGGYVRLKRRWALGDVVSVAFDMPCVAHVLDGHVAFTDYASAGNTWMQDSSYRVWLPLELNAFAK